MLKPSSSVSLTTRHTCTSIKTKNEKRNNNNQRKKLMNLRVAERLDDLVKQGQQSIEKPHSDAETDHQQ